MRRVSAWTARRRAGGVAPKREAAMPSSELCPSARRRQHAGSGRYQRLVGRLRVSHLRETVASVQPVGRDHGRQPRHFALVHPGLGRPAFGLPARGGARCLNRRGQPADRTCGTDVHLHGAHRLVLRARPRPQRRDSERGLERNPAQRQRGRTAVAAGEPAGTGERLVSGARLDHDVRWWRPDIDHARRPIVGINGSPSDRSTPDRTYGWDSPPPTAPPLR